MEKQLRDWTLRELQEHCNTVDFCENCDFFSAKGCKFNTCSPDAWELTTAWTEQELILMKILLDNGWLRLRYLDNGILTIENDSHVNSFPESLFPSLKTFKGVINLIDVLKKGE